MICYEPAAESSNWELQFLFLLHTLLVRKRKISKRINGMHLYIVLHNRFAAIGPGRDHLSLVRLRPQIFVSANQLSLMHITSIWSLVIAALH